MRLLLVSFVLVMISAASAQTSATTAPATMNLWVPGTDWALAIRDAGYKVDEREVAPGGRAARLFAANKRTGVLVSAFIEPAQGSDGASPAAARAYYLANLQESPMKPMDVKVWEEGAFAMAQFTTAIAPGQKDFTRTSLHIYGAKAGFWTDVHFSTMANEAQKLTGLASAVGFIENYRPTAADQEAANAPIQKLERQLADAGLKPEQAKAIYLRLAVAYGKTGQITQAREVLNRGLTKYPDYPLFYYNLACADAEEGNVESAIANLRQAWRNKYALGKGEQLPDPTTDSSFAEAMKVERFRKAVAELKEQ